MLGFPLPFPGSRRPCKPRTEQRGAAGRPGKGAVKNIFETLYQQKLAKDVHGQVYILASSTILTI